MLLICLCSDLLVPLCSERVRVSRPLRLLHLLNYPVVAPGFIFGMLGRPLESLFISVVSLGQWDGGMKQCLVMVLGARWVRLEIFPCGHSIAADVLISRTVLWLLA